MASRIGRRKFLAAAWRPGRSRRARSNRRCRLSDSSPARRLMPSLPLHSVMASTKPATSRVKMWRWSTTGGTANTTACRRSWPTLSAVAWPLSPRPAVTPLRLRPKLQPRQNASTSREIEAALGTLLRDRADALFVAGDAFFRSRRVQLATLTARHAFPRSIPFARMSKSVA